MKSDIQHGMAKNIQMDYNIRNWWNEIATKGGEAGRDFAMSALQEEGRTKVADENLPNYMKGHWGAGRHLYDYRPAEIEGKRVASRETGGYLAALQKEYESIGNRKEFWNKYMKDFSIYKEGGTPLTDRWHGKELYRIPSEVSGSSFRDLFPDLEVPTEYDENYWLSPQVIEEEENV
jgi:hypothetical protein